MKAMIFAAGLGTRFKPWTDHHPKALALVHGKSLLQRNIEYLQQFDITEVIVNVHHYADQVKEALEKSKSWGSQVTVSDESDALLETGGGLLRARDFLQDDTFLTLNVDILTELNPKYFLAQHQQQQSLITLAVMNRESSRHLLFNKYHRLCGWRNNSTGEEKIALQAKDYLPRAYSGIALFEPSVFDLIPLTGRFSLIDLYLALAPANKIACYEHDGERLLDVGKPDSVEKAEQMFA